MKSIKFLCLCLFIGTILLTGCKKDDDDDNGGLDGFWKVDETLCIQISGSKGYIMLLDAETQQPGLGKHLKVGDEFIRNLKQTSEYTWTCDEIMWWYNTYTNEVMYLEWTTSVFSSNFNKTEIYRSSEDGIVTFYKVNHILDPIPDTRGNNTPVAPHEDAPGNTRKGCIH